MTAAANIQPQGFGVTSSPRSEAALNFTRSESIAQLGAALAAAQGEIASAAKDRENPHFKQSYATLASVWNACRAALAKNGLAVIQPVGVEGKRVTVTTLLTHKSGEWICADLVLEANQPGPQGAGSAITYGRRYGLAAMVGVAPDDDDDGHEAQQSGPPQGQRRQLSDADSRKFQAPPAGAPARGAAQRGDPAPTKTMAPPAPANPPPVPAPAAASSTPSPVADPMDARIEKIATHLKTVADLAALRAAFPTVDKLPNDYRDMMLADYVMALLRLTKVATAETINDFADEWAKLDTAKILTREEYDSGLAAFNARAQEVG